MEPKSPCFLLYQIGGDFLSIAQRIKDEGYPVYLYQQKKEQIKGREGTAEGLLNKDEITDDAWSIINKYSPEEIVIVTDDNGEGDLFDHLREDGYSVIGGSSWADDIEHKRSKGTQLMERIGLNLPEEHDFTDIDDALEFLDELEDEEVRFVFKPEGESFAGGSKTYTAKNKQDLVDYLKWIQTDCGDKHYVIEKFILQQFVEGIEADFEAMFNGVQFMPGSLALDIEEKKSGDGNKGEAVGCMGNIELYIKESKFFDDYMTKLAPILRKAKYVGPISINCIFAKETPYNKKHVVDLQVGMPYGLEFTSRFGWDATLTQMALLKESGLNISDWLLSIVNGEDFPFPHGKIGCGVRAYTGSISLKKDEVSGRRFSFNPEVVANLFFYSVSFKSTSKDTPDYSYMIEDNPVLVCNTVGQSLQKTIDECYKILKEDVSIPDVHYRMEIGKRAKEVILFLKKFNWI